ncbi:MAG TPA: hypothetical protein VIJ86_09785 [Acidimicrobiales bacterium]
MRYHTTLAATRRTVRGRVITTGLVAGSVLAVVGASAMSGASIGHASSSVVVSTAKSATNGTILVSDRTVYTLAPSKVACASACYKIWPPLLLPVGSTKVTAGRGVSAAKLSSVKLANGRRQVTYGGRLLYWFYLDKSAGQVKGNTTDKWGKWTDVVLLKPAGGTPTTTTTSGGGGGGIGF